MGDRGLRTGCASAGGALTELCLSLTAGRGKGDWWRPQESRLHSLQLPSSFGNGK